jgi:hypothetical protein
MIAISYRREDSLPIAGRLYDRLQSEFGKGNVFMDFDSIPYGVDFRDHIKQMIDQSKVLVAIIGPNWMGKRKHRARRIDDPADFVRLEIAYALERKLPIIPILVSNTQMPRSEELPQDIQALAFRNGLSLDVGIDFHHHAERLTGAINRLLPGPSTTETETDSSSVTSVPGAEAEAKAVNPERPSVAPSPAVSKPRSERVEPRREELSPEIKIEQSATPTPSTIRDRKPSPFIDFNAQRKALRAMAERFRQAFGNAFSAVNSGTSRISGLIAHGIRRSLRSFAQLLLRRGKVIALSGVVIVAVAVVAGGVYWGVRSGTFQRLVTRTGESLKSKRDKQMQPMQPPADLKKPQVNESAVPVVRSRGALKIDTTPEGESFEIVDSAEQRHLGKTPIIIDDLPTGFTQIVFKRDGFADNTQTVWIDANSQSSVEWNFPETDRLTAALSAPPNSTPTPLVAIVPTPPTADATASPTQTAQSWRDRVSDFVRQFITVNQSQDANATVDFYAPFVDYFGARGKDHTFILHDVEKYDVDWPTRRDSIDGDVTVEEKLPNQQYRATYKLNLYAENLKTNDWTKGQVATFLDVNIIDGVPKIVAINQKKLQRPQHGKGKGPRPPELEAALQPVNPKKLTKIVVKKYGFAALLPTDLFPDAEMRLSDGNTDRLSSTRGCATVTFSSSRGAVPKVYDNCLAQFRSAPDHRKIDYKVIKENWFVVSGGNSTTGYYTKGVQNGEQVFTMALEYSGRLCNIPNAMLAEISHSFDGKTENTIQGTSETTIPKSAEVQKLIPVKLKKYGVSAALPPDVFPNAEKLAISGDLLLGQSWSGRTTLRFFSTDHSLKKAYSEFVEKHATNYKVLKDTWFVVSGDLGTVSGVDMGFYAKGIKKGNHVIIMDLEYQDDDFPFSDDTFEAMVRSFASN